jgi:predicted SAM-dependent methyltransferase
MLRSGATCESIVGAGSTSLPGWLNTDIDGSAAYVLDATRRWPVPEGSVAYIFRDNFIEHMTLPDVRAFLMNARGAMAPAARMRLVTPDVATTARLYLEGGPEADALIERHRRNGYQMTYPVDLLRVLFAESEHWLGYCFDEASLRNELETAGFEKVCRYRVGESDDPVLWALEIRAEPVEDTMQLVLEALAPRQASGE